MSANNILLKRNNKNFYAGFCWLKAELPALIHQLPLLHPTELAYFSSLKHDRRKLSYLLGKISAKKAICEIVEGQQIASLFIDAGIFLFPVVKNCVAQNIQLNISHCDNIGVALAFPEEHPLGIDIEKIDIEKINAIKGQITEKELKLITANHLSEIEGCTIIWTIKEGLSKIFKTGMMLDFIVLEIETITKHEDVFISTFKYCAQYKAISCKAGNYICSIIIPKNTEPELDNFWKIFKTLA